MKVKKLNFKLKCIDYDKAIILIETVETLQQGMRPFDIGLST